MITALAFDQSPSHTGWAVITDDLAARWQFGTIEMSDYGGNDVLMMRDFRTELHKMFAEFKPSMVFYEQVVSRKGALNMPVLERQFDVIACIKYSCMDHDLRAVRVLIGEWRKWFCGRGNANKDDAIRECLARNIYAENDHEAEAIGIADFGLSTISAEYRRRRKGEVIRREIAQRREAMEK